MAKVKVVNHNGFDYGLVINLSGEPRRITVKKNSFIMLEKDEIYQIDSTSRTFRDGFLRLESEEVKEEIGQVDENPNDLTKEEIEVILSEHPKKIEKQLADISALHVRNKIVDVAKEMDLTAGRLKVIKEAFGVDVFADATDNEV
jgi:hypothetical protein